MRNKSQYTSEQILTFLQETGLVDRVPVYDDENSKLYLLHGTCNIYFQPSICDFTHRGCVYHTISEARKRWRDNLKYKIEQLKDDIKVARKCIKDHEDQLKLGWAKRNEEAF
jgi:hypothetical protein